MNRQDALRELLDIQHKVGALIHALKNDAGDGPSPSDRSYFDPANPTHLSEVNALFDQYQLNDKRRSWFLNHGLQGVRMFDLADAVDKKVKSYEARFPGAARVYSQRAQGRH